MAEELARWSVTYTKHIKQKRKVYQDGYLLLSGNKAMLHDESDKLLVSKVLKDDENLRPGESLTFSSYLVDIGDPENAGSAQDEKSNKSLASDTKSVPGRQKTSAISISPSQRIIRDFKKNEMIKSALQERSPSSASATAGEWQALYTTHLTQKAKKYHDGFIRLVLCGTQGRQVKLYDSSKTLLSSRFLRKDETIRSGESLKMDGYLVDIGDLENQEKLVDVKAEGQKSNNPRENGTVERSWSQHCSSNDAKVSGIRRRKFVQSHLTAYKSAAKAISGVDACPRKDVEVNSSGVVSNKVESRKIDAPSVSFRGAHEILSFLKRPTAASDTIGPEQVPKMQNCPSPLLVQLDSGDKYRQESEQKSAESIQTNSKTEKSAESRRVDFVDLSHEIKVEKDSDDEIAVQHASSSAAMLSSFKRPIPSPGGLCKAAATKNTYNSQTVTRSAADITMPSYVNLEKPKLQALASSKGVADSTSSLHPTKTQFAEHGQHTTSNVLREANTGFEVQTACATTTKSAGKKKDWPSFDLGI